MLILLLLRFSLGNFLSTNSASKSHQNLFNISYKQTKRNSRLHFTYIVEELFFRPRMFFYPQTLVFINVKLIYRLSLFILIKLNILHEFSMFWSLRATFLSYTRVNMYFLREFIRCFDNNAGNIFHESPIVLMKYLT